MTDLARDFARFLRESGVLRLGEFTLKSGRTSPYFLDFGAISSGRDLTRLGEFFARHLMEQLGGRFDRIYGPAYKGIPLAAATCQGLWTLYGRDIPYFSLRKEVKDHGEKGRVLGRAPGAEDRIVLVDDVFTTGATKREAIKALPAGRPVAAAVGVDRQETDEEGRPAAAAFAQDTGVAVIPLLTVRGLFDHLELEPHTRRRLEAYLP